MSAPSNWQPVVATVARDVFVTGDIMTATSTTDAREVSAALERSLGSNRVLRGVALAPYTTFKIGGPADWFFEARTADELATAVSTARALDLPHFVLGLGANILLCDRGFRGLLIRNVAAHHHCASDGHLTSESGAIVKDLIQEAVSRGWSGLEHYVGI